MSAIVELIATAREPRTAAELWFEIDTMRRNGCASEDLPLNKGECDRMLRMQKFAGRLVETVGEGGVSLWSVAPQVVEKRREQKALFG